MHAEFSIHIPQVEIHRMPGDFKGRRHAANGCCTHPEPGHGYFPFRQVKTLCRPRQTRRWRDQSKGIRLF